MNLPPYNKTCIETKNLTFKYGNNEVLHDLSFKVKEGEYLGIIGPNGGGKTTLLKIILGLLKPTHGQILIHGQDPKNFKQRAQIGYVPQRASQMEAQFPATVQEIVESGRTSQIGFLKKISKKDFDAVEKAMETAGVTKLKNRLVNQLSGGERQKVLIARALAAEPNILILDEPTAAIDIASQKDFYEFLYNLNKKYHGTLHNLTIIIVSHDIDVVAKEVGTVLCLNRGLVCHGKAADLIKDENLAKLYGKDVKFILHGH